MEAGSFRKVALVTGGARGIGLGISKALAEQGFDLALCGIRDENAVQDVIAELAELGGAVHYCQADISSTSDRQKLLNFVQHELGRLHVLVNNAGVAPAVRADILDATEESFERLMRINLQGPYFLTQAAARWMISQKKADSNYSGCVINISSISSFVASTSRGDYCLTKAGVSMSTKLWAARLGEFNLPVYEVQPGLIKTDMTAAVSEKYDKLIDEGLLVESRWGTANDVGRVVSALATGELPYATGNVIRVDGGLGISRL